MVLSLLAHRIVIVIIAVAAVVGSLFVIPAYPTSYDTTVTVNMEEVQALIASYYSVNSVGGVTSGQSRVIDINALGITSGSLAAEFQLTVCVGGHCRTLSEAKLFPSIPTDTNLDVQSTVTVPYVPPGQQTITANLYVNGESEGSASGSMCVGC